MVVRRTLPPDTAADPMAGKAARGAGVADAAPARPPIRRHRRAALRGGGHGLPMATGFAARSGGTMRIGSAPGRRTTVSPSEFMECLTERAAPVTLAEAGR